MALRLLQIILPRELSEHADPILSDIPSDRIWRDQVGDDLCFTTVLLSADAVEPLTDALHDRFKADPNFRLILFPVEATRPTPAISTMAAATATTGPAAPVPQPFAPAPPAVPASAR